MTTSAPAMSRDTRAPSAPRLMTTAELAEFLQMDPERVYELRAKGTGPAFVKIGRDVRYAWPDVLAWLRSRTYTSTRSTRSAA